jgi:hypothetical protein
MSIDREYKIRVGIVADNSGAQQSSAALKDVGESATKAGDEAEHAAHGMFESHHEVHKLLHAIGNDAVPGMGRAFAALAMGPMGAIIAVATAVEFVKTKIEETNRALDVMQENSAKAWGNNDWLTGYVNASQEAAAESERLEEAMRKAASAGDEVKNRYDAEAKAINAVVAAIKEKVKAEGGSDSQAAGAQAAAEQMLQAARQRELFERQQNQGTLTGTAQSKQTPASVIQTRAQREADLQAQEAALGKATSEINTVANDEMREKIESNKALLEDSRKRYGNSDPLGLVKKMQEETDKLESESAEGRIAAAKARITELAAQVAKDKENAAQEKSALEDASNAATENTKRIVELQKQIAEANTAAQIKATSLSQLINGIGATADIKTFEKTAGVDTDAGAAAFVQKFFASQGRLTHRQGTAEDSQMVSLLNAVLQQTQQSDQRVYSLLQDLIRHKGDINQALNALAQQTSQIESRANRPNQ